MDPWGGLPAAVHAGPGQQGADEALCPEPQGQDLKKGLAGGGGWGGGGVRAQPQNTHQVAIRCQAYRARQGDCGDITF